LAFDSFLPQPLQLLVLWKIAQFLEGNSELFSPALLED
jgi:hypothetical protein